MKPENDSSTSTTTVSNIMSVNQINKNNLRETSTIKDPNENNHFTLLHLNIGRKNKTGNKNIPYKNRLEHLENVYQHYKHYDVIAIAEAGIDKENPYLESTCKYHNIWYSPNSEGNNDSTLLLLNKDWKAKTIHTGIERSQAIKVKVEKKRSIRIYLIYGPHGTVQKRTFWKKWQKYWEEKGTNDSIILGDLNEIISEELTDRIHKQGSNNNTNTSPNFLRELITATGLVDAYRYKNGAKREFTMTKIYKNGQISQSRIDHILCDFKIAQQLAEVKIKPFNKLLSDNHHAITTKINIKEQIRTQMRTQDPPEITLTRINTQELRENKETYQDAIRILTENNAILTNPEASAKDQFEELSKILSETATALAGTKKTIINKKNQKPTNNKLETLTSKITKLSKAQSSSAHLKQGDEPSKKIRKVLNECPMDPEGNWETWRKKAKEHLNNLIRERAKEQNKLFSETIAKRIKKIQDSGASNSPTYFWKKAKPHTKKGAMNRIQLENGERTADPQKVKKEIVKTWEKVWSKKEVNVKEDKPWHLTEAFKEMANRIKERELNPNESSARKISEEEMLLTLQKINKHEKATGVDNLPNELFAIAAQEIARPMTQIYNKFLEEGGIPESWKESKIYLIYKEGANSNEENPLDYRPISLLCVAYKIMAIILDSRIREVTEDLLSNEQGGFRKGRCCIQKIQTLTNVLEDAKTNKKEIYLCYLDVAKAYDSTSIEAVLDLLNRLNINKKTITILNILNQGNKSRIITPYGDTDPFPLENGLRQGCPLSPLLYILFLDPLIKYLNETQTGYTMEGTDNEGKTVRINNLAWADDQVLITNSPKDLQDLLDRTTQFMNHYNMSLNMGKNKTTHTSNTPNKHQLTYKRKDPGTNNYTNIDIPHLESYEAYKYLGIWITANLDWTKQKDAISKTIYINMNHLRWKAITPAQKVMITNMILMPTIEYRLQAVRFDKKTLRGWDRNIGREACRWFGWNHNDGFKPAFFKTHQGGLGLRRLEDQQEINLIASLLTFGLNGTDETTKKTLEAGLNANNRLTQWNQINNTLKKSGLTLERGKPKAYPINSIMPLIGTNPRLTYNIETFILKGRSEDKTRIEDYLNENMEPYSIRAMNEKHQWDLSYTHHHQLLQAIHKTATKSNQDPNRVKILKLLRRGRGSIQEREFESEPEKEGRQWKNAWTDGSLIKTQNGTKAGSSFCTSSNPKAGIQFYSRTAMYQNSYTAELYAIWTLLELAATNFNLKIYVDNTSAIITIEKAMKNLRTAKEARDDPNTPIIEAITRRIQQREGNTKLEHVYSHTIDLKPELSESEIIRRTDLMKTRYGPDWRRIAKGNLVADWLAKKGAQEQNISNSISKDRTAWLNVEGEHYSTGIRKTCKRQFNKLRTREANKYAEEKTGIKIQQKNIPYTTKGIKSDKSTHIFALKAHWGKLPTAARIHDKLPQILANPKLPEQRKAHLTQKYSNPACTFGCEEKEDQQHIWKCPKNPTKPVEEGLRPLLKARALGNKIDWSKEPTWLEPTQQIPGRWKEWNTKAADKLILPNNISEHFRERKGDEPIEKTIHECIISLAKKRWQAACDHRHGKDPEDLTRRRDEWKNRMQEKLLKEKKKKEDAQTNQRRTQQKTFFEYLHKAKNETKEIPKPPQPQEQPVPQDPGPPTPPRPPRPPDPPNPRTQTPTPNETEIPQPLTPSSQIKRRRIDLTTH